MKWCHLQQHGWTLEIIILKSVRPRKTNVRYYLYMEFKVWYKWTYFMIPRHRKQTYLANFGVWKKCRIHCVYCLGERQCAIVGRKCLRGQKTWALILILSLNKWAGKSYLIFVSRSSTINMHMYVCLLMWVCKV